MELIAGQQLIAFKETLPITNCLMNKNCSHEATQTGKYGTHVTNLIDFILFLVKYNTFNFYLLQRSKITVLQALKSHYVETVSKSLGF